MGYVARTAAASPLGIIEFVTALSSLEKRLVSTILPTPILPKYTTTVIMIPKIMYSSCPKLAKSPTKTKKNDLTKNVSWLWVGSSVSILGSLNFSILASRPLLPSIRPKTSAVRAPDSPNEFAKKNSTNSMPRVSMYACCAFPSFVETYIHGTPTPNPSTRPTTTALPMVSCRVWRSKDPARTASKRIKATMVARMSVSADSKLSIDFVSSDIRMLRTSPKTIAELLPPTMDASRTLSKSPHSRI